MKRFISIVLAVLTLSISSCTKWLDINTNPNYPATADASTLLPTAMMYTADKVGYDINLYAYFWAQYVVQCNTTNQYYTHMTYDVTNSSFTGVWAYIYGSIMPAIKQINQDYEGKEGYTNYVLEAKAMLIYNLYLLNSLYGPVAYSEGYVVESQNPKFDDEKAAYNIILNLCKEVRAMSAETAESDEKVNATSKADMVFGGDTKSWFQFVNTMYLKLLLRDFTTNKAEIEKLLSEDNFLASDAAFDNFEDKSDKSNPLYESDRRNLNTTNNIRACSDILGVLSAKDPRLAYYYDENVGDVFNGTPYGQTGDPKVVSRLAIGATDPVYFGTLDEALFLKAEAYARLNNVDKAQDCYEKAVTAAFLRTGCTGADEFLKADYAYDKTASEEAQIEQIINQKWAANVRCMPVEGWFDLNRTGYPQRGKTITDYNGVLASGYPQRFLISKTSTDYNTNAPDFVELNVKMWWQK